MNIFRVSVFLFIQIIIFTSCESEINFKNSPQKELKSADIPSSSENENLSDEIEIIKSRIFNIGPTGFEIEVDYLGDSNKNSTTVFYYCNETDTPGCNPKDGNSLNLNNSGDS